MPRRGRRPTDRRRPGAGNVDEETYAAEGEDPRKDRTAIFTKTKMCKFFILGCCSRGDSCQFAHEKEQLSTLPNLYRTKLCRVFINTGRCEEPDCRYAHSKEELRVVPGFSGTSGGQDGQGNEHELTDGGEFTPTPPPQAVKQANAAGQAPNFDGTSAAAYQQQFLQQANGLDLGTQMVMLQMGQAAQAHAVEAMRLQAMAACLQANSPLTGAGFPAMSQVAGLPTMQQGVLMGVPTAAGGGLPGAQGSPKGAGGPAGGKQQGAGNGRGQGRQSAGRVIVNRAAPGKAEVVVKNTFITIGEAQGQDAMARLRPVKTASARLDHLAAEVKNEDDDEIPPATDMPTKINVGTLRSMSSSGSLPIDGLQDVGDVLPGDIMPGSGGAAMPFSISQQEAGLDGGNADAVGWRVKNTFLDFDLGQNTPLSGRLRPIRTAAGRLDHLAEQEAYEDANWETDGPVVRLPATEKRSQDTPFTLGHGMKRVPTNPAFDGVAEEPTKAEEARLGGDVFAASLQSWAAPPLDGSANLTVKNTFLDFGPEEPRAALRAVHTAAGRLDLLGQE